MLVVAIAFAASTACGSSSQAVEEATTTAPPTSASSPQKGPTTNPESTSTTVAVVEENPSFSFILPSFGATANRDGLIRVRIDAVDVATESYDPKELQVHFCDGTVTEVLTGDFTVGDPVRISCFATLDDGSSLDLQDLASAAIEPTDEPKVDDEIMVAPNVDLNDPARFTAERLYVIGDDVLALDPVAFGGNEVPTEMQRGEGASAPSDVPTMSIDEFTDLWAAQQTDG